MMHLFLKVYIPVFLIIYVKLVNKMNVTYKGSIENFVYYINIC